MKIKVETTIADGEINCERYCQYFIDGIRVTCKIEKDAPRCGLFDDWIGKNEQGDYLKCDKCLNADTTEVVFAKTGAKNMLIVGNKCEEDK